MFKQGSVAEEISSSMEKELLSHQSEKQHGFNKIARAIELLGETAILFATAGMVEEEKEVVDVLGSLIKQLEQSK